MVDESAGSLTGDLDRLRAAGLYDPSSSTASQREELLRYLLERFSLDEIVHWAQRTNVFGIAARTIDRPPPSVSANEAATRAGVELETVMEFRAAVGFPVSDPDDRVLPETVIADVQTFMLGCELYERDEALAFARVLGWAATRVMEAARAMFGGSVVRMDDDARTELEVAKANEAGAWSTQPLGPQELRGISEHVHLSQAARRGQQYLEELRS